MASTPSVYTIIIPWDGSHPYIVEVFLAVPGTWDISINECIEEEEVLGIIPKIWARGSHQHTFSWAHRSLGLIPARDVPYHGGEWNETYLLYTCRDEDADLPLNLFMRRISDKLVYGDAYLFKLLVDGGLGDGADLPTYVNLDVNFLCSLNTRVPLSAVLLAVLDRLVEQEEEAWMDQMLNGPDRGIPNEPIEVLPNGIDVVLPNEFNGVLPNGPNGALPNGILPNGTLPNGPNGVLPNGINGMLPNGINEVLSNGTNGVLPYGINGALPNGIN